MKRVIFVLLYLAISLPAIAGDGGGESSGTGDGGGEIGFWVEAQAVSGKNPKKLILWYEKDFTETLGFYALASGESDRYRQFYIGPKWKPVNWLTLGVGIGREYFPNEFAGTRRNAFANAETERVSVWAIYENGPSGPWHKATATYKFDDRTGLGLMKETDLGIGPRLEYTFKEEKVQVWGAALRGRHPNKNNFVLGVNISF